MRTDPWRQQRSLNERDLLTVGGSYGGSTDFRLLGHTNQRLYASADQRDRYELQLQHRERLEQYPLTRTARLDVQQRNSLNRSNHERQFAAAGGAGGGVAAGGGVGGAGVGAGAFRRAPPLAAASGCGGSSSSSTSSSYYLSQSQSQSKPQIVIGPGAGVGAGVGAGTGAAAAGPGAGIAYERNGVMSATADGARGSLSRERGLLGTGGGGGGGGSSSLSSTEAAYWDEPPGSTSSSSAAQDSRRFTERRIKKTVRFDAHDDDTSLLVPTGSNGGPLPPVTTILPSTAVDVGAATLLTSAKLAQPHEGDWTRWEAERQGSQDSATKDSGIDTSSTFTSSEDSNRGDGPKVSDAGATASNQLFFLREETDLSLPRNLHFVCVESECVLCGTQNYLSVCLPVCSLLPYAPRIPISFFALLLYLSLSISVSFSLSLSLYMSSFHSQCLLFLSCLKVASPFIKVHIMYITPYSFPVAFLIGHIRKASQTL